MSQPGYVWYENAKAKHIPDRETIIKYAHALGVTPETLLGADQIILDWYDDDEKKLLSSEDSIPYIKLALAKMRNDRETKRGN
jgi:transcriptional regulator with XRE-family HTH domain